jgi:hypothetical protein
MAGVYVGLWKKLGDGFLCDADRQENDHKRILLKIGHIRF